MVAVQFLSVEEAFTTHRASPILRPEKSTSFADSWRRLTFCRPTSTPEAEGSGDAVSFTRTCGASPSGWEPVRTQTGAIPLATHQSDFVSHGREAIILASVPVLVLEHHTATGGDGKERQGRILSEALVSKTEIK